MADVNGDLSFPAFGMAATFEVKVTVTSALQYPIYVITSQSNVFNSFNSNNQYPAFTAEGIGGTIEADGDWSYPVFGIASEAESAYEVSMDLIMRSYETENDADVVKGRRQVLMLG